MVKILTKFNGDGAMEKESSNLTIRYQQGSANVGFVFSCPGKKERECGYVCAGTTGNNLQILIEKLYSLMPETFPSPNKSDYLITNASDRVHYKKLTGDTEAPLSEIFLSGNLSRLKKELEECDIVVCMGDKARSAVSKIEIKGRVVSGTHLSNCNINTHFESKQETASERKNERLQQVADLIVKNINIQKVGGQL